MDFEWDERKRLAHLIKHGVDFVRAIRIWENERVLIIEDRRRGVGSVAVSSVPGGRRAMKGKRIVKASEAQARRMPDKTDLKRLQRLTDNEIVKAAASDPDAAVLPLAFWKSALLTAPRGKRQVTLRLDAEVLDFFKRDGKGYQTKINRVLRAFVAAHQAR